MILIHRGSNEKSCRCLQKRPESKRDGTEKHKHPERERDSYGDGHIKVHGEEMRIRRDKN